MKVKVVSILLASTLLFGCGASNAVKGGLIGTGAGAALGAGIGAIFGGKKGAAYGAIAGGAVGGTTGVIIGRKMDKQAEELRRSVPGAEVKRVGEGIDVEFTDANGFHFDSGKAILSQNSKNTLDKLAVVLKKYPDTNLLVDGHTDSDGSESFNKSLSYKRANAVGDYLKSKGIPSSHFTVNGEGESNPIASNETAAGKAKNRRVELVITANETMKKKAEAEAKARK